MRHWLGLTLAEHVGVDLKKKERKKERKRKKKKRKKEKTRKKNRKKNLLMV